MVYIDTNSSIRIVKLVLIMATASHQPERLIVYVDGFNLYHGLHDDSGHSLLWLDLVKLAQRLRPHQQLIGVKYFTASVLNDPAAQYGPSCPCRETDKPGAVHLRSIPAKTFLPRTQVTHACIICYRSRKTQECSTSTLFCRLR